MPALTKRQLHKRINDAIAEAAAALLFYGAPKKRLRERDLRYANGQMIKSLVYIADGLEDGFEPTDGCEACGKPIRAGQAYAHNNDDGISFHAKCAGVDPKRCARQETERERRASGRHYRDAAKAYLRSRSL